MHGLLPRHLLVHHGVFGIERLYLVRLEHFGALGVDGVRNIVPRGDVPVDLDLAVVLELPGGDLRVFGRGVGRVHELRLVVVLGGRRDVVRERVRIGCDCGGPSVRRVGVDPGRAGGSAYGRRVRAAGRGHIAVEHGGDHGGNGSDHRRAGLVQGERRGLVPVLLHLRRHAGDADGFNRHGRFCDVDVAVGG